MSPVSATARTEWSLRLAQTLVAGGYATETNLSPLLTEAQATGQPLGTLLISRQLALPGVVVGALAQLAQLPAVDLAAAPLDDQVFALIPNTAAREYNAVAMKVDGNHLAVAFAEPPADEDVQALSSLSGYRVAPMLADPTVISAILTSGPASLQRRNDDASPAQQMEDRVLNQAMPSVEPADESVPLHIDDLLRYTVSVGRRRIST